jgi:DNA-directed RNA polymerase I, II, and III subunit RPABC1
MEQEKIKETTTEMLQQRGFEVSEIDDELVASAKGKASIIVFFNQSPKINNDRVQEYILKMRNDNFTHAIIIYNDAVTSTAQKVIDELKGMRIELFQKKTLRYNITKHRLVPTHSLLTKSEMKTFKEEYGTKIPIILYNDPVARFFDFQRGDIVKVERKNGFVCYRIVK